MKKIYIAAVDSIFIIAMFAGCSPTVTPSGVFELPSNAQNYQVEIFDLTEPVLEKIRTENIDQPNCNGTGDVDNVVERTMGINHTVELGLGLTVDADGKLELFGTGVDLGAAISNELGYQYGVTESITRSITVRAAPKSHMVHTVKLSEIWESGTARVIVNGQSTDIPFRFRANFSIDLIDSVPVDCTIGQSIATQGISTIIPADTPVVTISKGNLIYECDFTTSCEWNIETGMKTESNTMFISPGYDAVLGSTSSFSNFILEAKFLLPPSPSSMSFYVRHQRPACADWNCSIQIGLYNQEVVARRFLGDKSNQQIDIVKNRSVGSFRSNDWNIIVIVAQGDNYKVYINDVLALDFDDNTYNTGSFIIDNARDSISEVKVDYFRVYTIQ